MQRPVIVEQVPLTATEAAAWDASRTLMMVGTPHLSHVLYELLSPPGGPDTHRAIFTEEIPVAGTDGAALFINPTTFFPYPPGQRHFILGHEVLHCIFNHPAIFEALSQQGHVLYPDGVKLPWVIDIAQWAGDYVINAILVEGKVGEKPEKCLLDTTIATSATDFLGAYRKLYERLPPQIKNLLQSGDDGGNTWIRSQKSSQFDQLLKPGTAQGIDPQQAQTERNDSHWRIIVDQAMDMARQQGRLPQSMERAFKGVLEPKVDWTEHIHASINRIFTGDRWAYDEPQHEWLSRDIYVPSRSGYGGADVVVGGDVSGSVSDYELSMAKAEIAGILQQIKPRRVVLIWCDAAVQETHVLTDMAELAAMPNPHGGGGTNFIPVFEWVEEHRAELDLAIDGMVYITDGAGTYPTRAPDYPVVWGMVTNAHPVPPFGETVYIPKQVTKGGAASKT